MRPERGGVEDLPQHTFEAKVTGQLVRDAARKERWIRSRLFRSAIESCCGFWNHSSVGL
jgi:hypothetical protein